MKFSDPFKFGVPDIEFVFQPREFRRWLVPQGAGVYRTGEINGAVCDCARKNADDQ